MDEELKAHRNQDVITYQYLTSKILAQGSRGTGSCFNSQVHRHIYNGPGVHFTNEFSIVIQIQWKYVLV